jgi:hypothetical protein
LGRWVRCCSLRENLTYPYAGEEPTSCPVPGLYPSRGCKQCVNRPPNSEYIPPRDGMYCLWKCNPGYFASDEAAGLLAIAGEIDSSYFMNGVVQHECRACTVRNETNCPTGMIPVDCTDSRDFSCSQPCASGTKPLLNSRWLSNTVGGSVCQWQCVDGHEAIPTPSGLWFCRAI